MAQHWLRKAEAGKMWSSAQIVDHSDHSRNVGRAMDVRDARTRKKQERALRDLYEKRAYEGGGGEGAEHRNNKARNLQMEKCDSISSDRLPRTNMLVTPKMRAEKDKLRNEKIKMMMKSMKQSDDLLAAEEEKAISNAASNAGPKSGGAGALKAGKKGTKKKAEAKTQAPSEDTRDKRKKGRGVHFAEQMETLHGEIHEGYKGYDEGGVGAESKQESKRATKKERKEARRAESKEEQLAGDKRKRKRKKKRKGGPETGSSCSSRVKNAGTVSSMVAGHMPVEEWDIPRVGLWLRDQGNFGGEKEGAYVRAFSAAGVDGGILLQLDDTDLQEVGISAAVDRAAIISGVRELRGELPLDSSAASTERGSERLQARLQAARKRAATAAVERHQQRKSPRQINTQISSPARESAREGSSRSRHSSKHDSDNKEEERSRRRAKALGAPMRSGRGGPDGRDGEVPDYKKKAPPTAAASYTAAGYNDEGYAGGREDNSPRNVAGVRVKSKRSGQRTKGSKSEDRGELRFESGAGAGGESKRRPAGPVPAHKRKPPPLSAPPAAIDDRL
jgi:hypothetical protein